MQYITSYYLCQRVLSELKFSAAGHPVPFCVLEIQAGGNGDILVGGGQHRASGFLDRGNVLNPSVVRAALDNCRWHDDFNDRRFVRSKNQVVLGSRLDGGDGADEQRGKNGFDHR